MYYLEDKFEALETHQSRLASRFQIFRCFNGLNWLATILMSLTFLPFCLFSLFVLLPFWLYERIVLLPVWFQGLILLVLLKLPLAFVWLWMAWKKGLSGRRRDPWVYVTSLIFYWVVVLPFSVVFLVLLMVPLIIGLFLYTLHANWILEAHPAVYALIFVANLILSWLAFRRGHTCTAPNAVRCKCPGRWARGWSIVSISLVLAAPWIIDNYRSVLEAAFSGW